MDFERRAGSGAAGDRKVNGFQLKSFRKPPILSAGPCREGPGIEKSSVFNCKPLENHRFSLVFLCFSMFRQYPGSGSFGGRVWGPRCIFFAYSRTAIWALFAKQEWHQIASTIATCTRTNEEPCIPGPLCSCTDTDLCGTLLPAGRSNFGGSPRAQSYMIRPDLGDSGVGSLGDDAASRSDPTFTRASQGLRQ